MKQTIAGLTIFFLFTTAAPAPAEESSIDYSPGFVIFDILLYRPVGVAATLIGSCLFVGLSPLTALAQISPPHDAFEKTADILVVSPFKYTFDRPVGEWRFPDKDAQETISSEAY
ncbi:MAG: hypothetical protein ACU833_02865 [Gammaproteobacteria bacterium]